MLHTPPPAIIRPACTFYTDNGSRNADGTNYNQASPFAATRLYGMHSRLRVTNAANGKSLVVTVRDLPARRFHGIDLPKRFWHQLSSRGGYRVGVLHVSVHVLSPATRRRHKGGRGR